MDIEYEYQCEFRGLYLQRAHRYGLAGISSLCVTVDFLGRDDRLDICQDEFHQMNKSKKIYPERYLTN